jgi:hypothetical protein
MMLKILKNTPYIVRDSVNILDLLILAEKIRRKVLSVNGLSYVH